MSEDKTMYELMLNESIYIEGYRITRVPGGWIYQTQSPTSIGMVFVPYNYEPFMN